MDLENIERLLRIIRLDIRANKPEGLTPQADIQLQLALIAIDAAYTHIDAASLFQAQALAESSR